MRDAEMGLPAGSDRTGSSFAVPSELAELAAVLDIDEAMNIPISLLHTSGMWHTQSSCSQMSGSGQWGSVCLADALPNLCAACGTDVITSSPLSDWVFFALPLKESTAWEYPYDLDLCCELTRRLGIAANWAESSGFYMLAGELHNATVRSESEAMRLAWLFDSDGVLRRLAVMEAARGLASSALINSQTETGVAPVSPIEAWARGPVPLAAWAQAVTAAQPLPLAPDMHTIEKVTAAATHEVMAGPVGDATTERFGPRSLCTVAEVLQEYERDAYLMAEGDARMYLVAARSQSQQSAPLWAALTLRAGVGVERTGVLVKGMAAFGLARLLGDAQVVTLPPQVHGVYGAPGERLLLCTFASLWAGGIDDPAEALTAAIAAVR